MIWVDSQISKEQGFAAWLATATIGSIVTNTASTCASSFGSSSFKTHRFLKHCPRRRYQGGCLLPLRSALTPHLERAGLLCYSLLIQVIGIEDQRFPLRVEHAPVRFLRRSGTGHVVHFRDIQIPRTHKFPNVTVVREQFLLLIHGSVTLAQQVR